MQGGAGAGRAVADLAGIGLGVGQKILERRPGRVLLHHDAKGIARQAHDVAEVVDRIERGLAGEGIAKHRDRDLRDGVAVRRAVGRHLQRSQHAAGAGPVLDHDRLAEMLLGRGGQRAKPDVGGAARRQTARSASPAVSGNPARGRARTRNQPAPPRRHRAAAPTTNSFRASSIPSPTTLTMAPVSRDSSCDSMVKAGVR